MSRTPRRIAAIACGATLTVTGLVPVLTPSRAATPQKATTRLATSSVATQAAIAAVKNPKVTWYRCQPGLQCGTLVVPLDYDDPSLGTIELPISRRPADDAKHRIGALFTNPGGPGGPATQTVSLFAGDLGAQIRHRFDIVGLGPRGIEGDEQAVCTGAKGTTEPPMGGDAYPMNAKEQAQHFAHDKAVRTACSQNQPRILAHMTTADDARDMDLARRALGDKKLSYYGISYGSFLGETYAALFPGNIRALVVDGVLDPVAWTTGTKTQQLVPVTERIGSGRGSHEAMESMISECERVGTAYCPEAGTVRSDWKTIQAILTAGPVDMGWGFSLRLDDVVSIIDGILYSPEQVGMLPSVLHDLRVQLQTLVDYQNAQKMNQGQVSAASAQKLATQRKKTSGVVKRLHTLLAQAAANRPLTAGAKNNPAGTWGAAETPSPTATPSSTPDPTSTATPTSTPTSTDTPTAPATPVPTDPSTDSSSVPAGPPMYYVGFEGVLCSDSVNPRINAAWVTADKRVKATQGGFGQMWLWASSMCAGWPVKTNDAYRGPFTKATSNTVLIFGNQHDPATPYSGAVAYHKLQKNSRLVTLANGYGHGALEVSNCADDVRTNYLVTAKAPGKDVTCQPDHPLFTRLG